MKSPLSILIADDHALMREGLVELLNRHADLRVIATAANGREAVKLARAQRPDIAIVDISMPELNGIDAIHELARHAPATRVIMLSMHAGAQHVMQALAAGAKGYLLKQSAASEVANAVRAVAAGRRYLSPAVAAIVAEHLGNPAPANPLDSLSKRERQILQLVAEGKSSAGIGRDLNISPKTVDTYRSRLMQKLGVKDLASLITLAILHGLTPLE
jgi:DNA-binding NarL/FixJ family response regulator